MNKQEPMNVSVTSSVGWWRELVRYLSNIDEANQAKKRDLDNFVGYLKDMLTNKDAYY
jgi:Holliday junction resolvase RusA-like endonuclease